MAFIWLNSRHMGFNMHLEISCCVHGYWWEGNPTIATPSSFPLPFELSSPSCLFHPCLLSPSEGTCMKLSAAAPFHLKHVFSPSSSLFGVDSDCWFRVYPVTESYKGSESLKGRPMKEGFNSHYVLTTRDGKSPFLLNPLFLIHKQNTVRNSSCFPPYLSPFVLSIRFPFVRGEGDRRRWSNKSPLIFFCSSPDLLFFQIISPMFVHYEMDL